MKRLIMMIIALVAASKCAANEPPHEPDFEASGRHVIGRDAAGRALLCGVGDESETRLFAIPDSLSHEWEVRPSALLADSPDPIYVHTRPNRPVKTLKLVFPSSDVRVPENLNFHDDGTDGDSVAGDGSYALGPFYLLSHQAAITPAPTVLTLGYIQSVGTDDAISRFHIETTVGVLPAGTPIATPFKLREDAQVASHMLNLSWDGFASQIWMRGVSNEVFTTYIKTIFDVVEDDYDFIVLMTSGKLERAYDVYGVNGRAGLGLTTKSPPIAGDWVQSHLYGSAGRLAHICGLDYQSRGMLPSNLLHEILHRWGAYIDTSLGLTDGTGHYFANSSAGSLLGGMKWEDWGDGSFRVDGSIGRGGAYRASPVDLLLMGLADPAEMADLYRATNIQVPQSGDIFRASDIVYRVSGNEILAAHPESSLDFDNPLTRFRILFVIDSDNRLLSPVELSYYNAFVREALRTLPANAPDPYVSASWAPITRFFGESVTLNAFPSVRAEYLDTRVDHDGDGYPSAIELQLGTNAFDALSHPELSLRKQNNRWEVVLRPYRANTKIELQTSAELENWTEGTAQWVLDDDGETISVAVDGQLFVRLRAGQ